MEFITNAATGLVFNVIAILIGPTIVLLLLRRFVPVLGEELWRGYCRILVWLVRLPFMLIRIAVRELAGRHNP